MGISWELARNAESQVGITHAPWGCRRSCMNFVAWVVKGLSCGGSQNWFSSRLSTYWLVILDGLLILFYLSFLICRMGDNNCAHLRVLVMRPLWAHVPIALSTMIVPASVYQGSEFLCRSISPRMRRTGTRSFSFGIIDLLVGGT